MREGPSVGLLSLFSIDIARAGAQVDDEKQKKAKINETKKKRSVVGVTLFFFIVPFGRTG